MAAVLGTTFAIAPTAAAPTPSPAQPAEVPVAGDACGTKPPNETAQQVLTRLSCAVGAAVRSQITPGARIERLTMPGETPPSDPFLLYSRRIGETGDAPMVHYLGVRVSDDRGAGSIYVRILQPAGYGAVSCETTGIPKPDSCSTRQIAEGVLLETSRTRDGLIVRTTQLSTSTATISIVTNNSGLMESGDGIYLPVQSAEPPLTWPQLQNIAAAPGLVP